MVALKRIDDPAAEAVVTWLTPEEGGRLSGPPTMPVYATNCAFPLGGESEIHPNWPRDADPSLTIFIQRLGSEVAWSERAWIAFIAPELARPYVRVGVEISVLEGYRLVGRCVVTELLGFAQPSD